MVESSTYRSGYIAIIGPANAGKSTLLNSILGKKLCIVSPKPQTTRDRILGVKTVKGAQMLFVDTPGSLNRRKLGALGRHLEDEIRSALEEVDITVLVLDSRALTRSAVPLEEFRTRKIDFIVLNKVDLVQKEKLLPIMERIHREFEGPPTIVPLSALKRDGVELLEKLILEKLPEGPRYFPEGQLTDRPEEFLVSEVIREKVFLHLREEIPYSTAVRIERWQEDEGLERISANILVERDSQKGIVIGKGGLMLKRIGTEARQELEHMLGAKIFLELHVGVEENWTESERGLERVSGSLVDASVVEGGE